ICLEMLAFQESNNRLSLDDEVATVEDKSFSMIDDEQKAALASAATEKVADDSVKTFDPAAAGVDQAVASAQKQSGIMAGLRNLFRSP
ncbi:MAG TPA: hypothetical protein PLI89_14645, partial [Chitinophagales bacterium]|nr:hypothetical protein [Chitinophagales bacterium]